MTDDMEKRIMANTDEDGYVDGALAATAVVFPMALESPEQYPIFKDEANRFVAFVCDNGAEDIQVRIPFEMVEQMAAYIKRD